MSYDDAISRLVDVVEGVGVGIMVIGALAAFAVYAQRVHQGAGRAYEQLRENVGRVILLGLELLIIADIIQTIVVEPSLESVAVLGIIVVIRIVLSFSLEVEIDGVWPWRRARTTTPELSESRRVASAGADRVRPAR